MKSMRWMMLLLLSTSALACADDEEGVEPAACGEPADAFVVNSSAVDHSCDHVVGGPFDDLTASSTSEADPPLLENQHMFYTVTLQEEGGAHAGSFKIRMPFNGTFTVHLSEEMPIQMTALDDGSGTCNAANQVLTDCSGLHSAHLYTIDGQREYRVDLGPTDAETVGVLLEEHIIVAQ